MQLRLNPAHPLCQPSRNLVFAAFGTGAGGQVLDLADRPTHGIIRDERAVPLVSRSLQSVRPPGFPADWQPLTMRNTDTAFSGVEFGAGKVSAIVDDFTVAMWVRPYDLTTNYPIPISTGIGAISGWLVLTSCLTGEWPANAWGVSMSSGGIEWLRVGSRTLNLGEWNLVAFTFLYSRSPRLQLWLDGTLETLSYATADWGPSAGSRFTIGTFDNGTKYPARSDIGPSFVWNSVLSADDIALLYRDTWGMVTRGSNLLRTASTGATTTTTSSTTTLCYQGRTRFGLFSYLPGCGAIQWRNSRFKRSQ